VILYYSQGTRVFPVLWTLEELNAKYELVVLDLKQGEQQSKEYKRLNPMMKVPTLADSDVVVSETGAILQYIAEENPSGGLLPEIGDPLRPACPRWLFFVGSSLEPAMGEKFNG
jgi:glutathione S-transferase